jgi:hypothetical protein
VLLLLLLLRGEVVEPNARDKGLLSLCVLSFFTLLGH